MVQSSIESVIALALNSQKSYATLAKCERENYFKILLLGQGAVTEGRPGGVGPHVHVLPQGPLTLARPQS